MVYVEDFTAFRDKVRVNQDTISQSFCVTQDDNLLPEEEAPTDHDVIKVDNFEVEDVVETDNDGLELAKPTIRQKRKSSNNVTALADDVKSYLENRLSKRRDCGPDAINRETNELNEKMTAMDWFNCELCEHTATTCPDHMAHYRTVHLMQGYVVCCAKRFATTVEAYDHMRHHLDANAFSCDECGKCFASSSRLRFHFKHKHLPQELCPYECKACGKRFSAPGFLSIHELSHMGEEARVHECGQCPKAFKSASDRNDHVKRVHENNRPFICASCEATFPDQVRLREHEHRMHNPARKKESCDICGLYILNVAKHKKLKHCQTKDPLPCKECGQEFLRRDLLRAHIRYNHEERKLKFACEECGKAMPTQAKLKEHSAVHTGIKAHRCYFCENRFCSTGSRIKHMQSKHSLEYDKWKAAKFKPPSEDCSKQ